MKLNEYLDQSRGRAAAIAREIKRSPAFVSQMSKGERPVPARCVPAIERLSGGEVRAWDLRPKDWWEQWPHLIGTEGAPPIPPAEEEARHAA
ncbi:transcriptional regulator [Roseateles cavernae]|uniref:transcriptional regulator n=1 Tax=Roseateles cavernae TaxID=3153578 RepID=UPI0032E4E4C9